MAEFQGCVHGTNEPKKDAVLKKSSPAFEPFFPTSPKFLKGCD